MTADCSACGGGWPRADHRLGELDTSVAYLNEDQFFAGWTFLVLKRHATEIYQLSRDERARLMEDVSAVAQALAAVFAPVKVNYELLGNQVAHIHWHVIPRLAGDPAPRMPTWTVQHEPRALPPAALAERLASIRARLPR